jgi:hypothetical protein
LILNVIEYAITEGMEVFDFGRGMEQYKLIWTKNFKKTNDITVFRKKQVGIIFIYSKKFYQKSKKYLLKFISVLNSLADRRNKLQTKSSILL